MWWFYVAGSGAGNIGVPRLHYMPPFEMYPLPGGGQAAVTGRRPDGSPRSGMAQPEQQFVGEPELDESIGSISSSDDDDPAACLLYPEPFTAMYVRTTTVT